MKIIKTILINLLGYPLTIPVILMEIVGEFLVLLSNDLFEGVVLPYRNLLMKVFKVKDEE